MRLCNDAAQLGFTACPEDWRNERIQLAMSSDTEWRQFPPGYAFGVLLHEMLHAYFAVWCRNDSEEAMWEPGQHLGHGVIFMAAARKIERRWASDMTSHPSSLCIRY